MGAVALLQKNIRYYRIGGAPVARYKTKIPPQSAKTNHLTPLWLVLAGVGLIAVALWAILGANSRHKATIEVTGAPRLKLEQDTYNYGDVQLGKTVQTTVRVTNVGDQTLRFTEAPYVEVLEGC
jgi:hypothetical protein